MAGEGVISFVLNYHPVSTQTAGAATPPIQGGELKTLKPPELSSWAVDGLDGEADGVDHIVVG